jgi:hypothetical protein
METQKVITQFFQYKNEILSSHKIEIENLLSKNSFLELVTFDGVKKEFKVTSVNEISNYITCSVNWIELRGSNFLFFINEQKIN